MGARVETSGSRSPDRHPVATRGTGRVGRPHGLLRRRDGWARTRGRLQGTWPRSVHALSFRCSLGTASARHIGTSQSSIVAGPQGDGINHSEERGGGMTPEGPEEHVSRPGVPSVLGHSPLAAVLVGVWRRYKGMQRRRAAAVGGVPSQQAIEPEGWWPSLRVERVCPTCNNSPAGGVILCPRCGALLNPRWWLIAFAGTVVLLVSPWLYMWWVGSVFL